MRTLRILSLGTSSPSWTPQVVPLRCTYIASQWQWSSACSPHHSLGMRVRKQGITAILHEVRSRPLGRALRSSLREFTELSTSGYGCFASPVLLTYQSRPYVSVAGKKGKKSDKDVLLKEREEDLAEEEHEGGTEEKVKGKKKLKGKKKEDGVEDVESAEAEAQLKQKKKKLKEILENGDARGTEEAQHSALNGAVSEQVEEPEVRTEEKGKKKLKSKAKHEEPEEEQSEKDDHEVEAPVKLKEEKKGKGEVEEVSDSEDEGIVSGLDALEEGEELESFDDIDTSADVIEGELADEFDEHLDDDDFWEDDFEPEAELGDGGDGGGIVLGDAPWAKSALHLAEEVVAEFNDDLALFAFRASKGSGIIRVRVDKLADKYGSPSMDEIEKFSASYSKRLEQAGQAGTIPDDLALEVSSPGAERVVRIPQDLERFKELPMYVRYIEKPNESDAETPEKDGILELESIDMEGGSTTWKLANVRINRELAGKGRGMNRKQRDWRAQLPFESLRLVRLYIDL